MKDLKGCRLTLGIIFSENITLSLLKTIIIRVHYNKILKIVHMTLLQ
jgi:hypothetical protein